MVREFPASCQICGVAVPVVAASSAQYANTRAKSGGGGSVARAIAFLMVLSEIDAPRAFRSHDLKSYLK